MIILTEWPCWKSDIVWNNVYHIICWSRVYRTPAFSQQTNLPLPNILFLIICETCAVYHFVLFPQDLALLTASSSPLSIHSNLSYLLVINGQICHTATRVHASTFKHSLRTAYTSCAPYPKSFVPLSDVINGVRVLCEASCIFRVNLITFKVLKKRTLESCVHTAPASAASASECICGTKPHLYFPLIFTSPAS